MSVLGQDTRRQHLALLSRTSGVSVELLEHLGTPRDTSSDHCRIVGMLLRVLSPQVPLLCSSKTALFLPSRLPFQKNLCVGDGTHIRLGSSNNETKSGGCQRILKQQSFWSAMEFLVD